ncbi:histidine phosphatase family protein [Bacillus sp. FJAT-44742]|uniref:histidine phosphatase family protein n=1 Tax=Bacillus sp. FJAT-44742 TaxID=2014005 RepID=UPI000C24EC35|nr:histidine phosphatase family protein [Bacillus sp. FJAT-44742]
MDLFLIRHGESEGNRAGKLQGCQDFPLSVEGKKQALLLGQFLKSTKLDALYSSDLSRAYETAKAIEKYQDVPIIASEAYREIHLGPFEGKTREEIYKEFPDMRNKNLLTSGIEGTEQVGVITERCQQLLNGLSEKHQEKTIALVSHGGFLSIFLMFLMLGDDWYQFHRPFRLGNTGVTKITVKHEGNPVIHYINRDTHLASKY